MEGAFSASNILDKTSKRVVEAHSGVASQIRVTGHVTLNRTQYTPVSARLDPAPTVLSYGRGTANQLLVSSVSTVARVNYKKTDFFVIENIF